MFGQQTHALGTFTGTGQIINVEVGFIPRFLAAFNYNDAGAVYPLNLWFQVMPAASACKITTATARITTLGFSEFAGEAPNKTLSQTATMSAAATTFTASAATIITELKAGDVIRVGAGTAMEEFTVVSVSGATVTVNVAATVAKSAGSPIVLGTGRQPGFVIGADTDMNVSGEVGYYLALR